LFVFQVNNPCRTIQSTGGYNNEERNVQKTYFHNDLFVSKNENGNILLKITWKNMNLTGDQWNAMVELLPRNFDPGSECALAASSCTAPHRGHEPAVFGTSLSFFWVPVLMTWGRDSFLFVLTRFSLFVLWFLLSPFTFQLSTFSSQFSFNYSPVKR
jgi:hypothetical protein